MDSGRLHEALDYLHAKSSGVGTDEMVIVRNGYLIWAGPNADNVHEMYSCTKTFTDTVLGLLATEGALNVDGYVTKYFPPLDDRYPEYVKIRFSHLATMTSGYDVIMGDGWSFYKTDPSTVIVRLSPASGGSVDVGSTKEFVWEGFLSRLKGGIAK